MASGPILIGFASDRFSWVAVVLPTDSRPMLVSWNQSSFKKMQPMAAAEVALKSPLIPLFQRGNYSIAVLTPLWKRGEGEISTRRYGNYLTNFNSRTLGPTRTRNALAAPPQPTGHRVLSVRFPPLTLAL